VVHVFKKKYFFLLVLLLLPINKLNVSKKKKKKIAYILTYVSYFIIATNYKNNRLYKEYIGQHIESFFFVILYQRNIMRNIILWFTTKLYFAFD